MVQGLFNAPQAVKPVLAMLFIQSGVRHLPICSAASFLNVPRSFLVGFYFFSFHNFKPLGSDISVKHGESGGG